ncbi:VRR-NUC domain-containing protein [Trueperella pyogenes]|uniref:VRR-NUC domain-containing protein n=1 Tax=Trueperella pyogenes TaxID=1661 RepID=UPI00324BF94C
MRETTIEKALTQAVHMAGGLCLKFVSPGWAGAPDRLCLLAGTAVFVEVKAPGKHPRPIQTHRHHQLATQGFHTITIDHPNQINEVLHALHAA